jgi:protein-tyrosine phosphatase
LENGLVPVVDLHSHILPELDDGALSVEDSVAMARQAWEDGIEVVCATPHIRHDHDIHIPEIAVRVAELQRSLDAEAVPVRILPGGELAQTAAEALTVEELHRVSLGGAGGWILLEPPPGPLGEEMGPTVEHLARLGARTIVAHPERHAGADLEQRLEALVEQGCLIQWTADFVVRAEPGDLVLRYARAGLVHLLASDAHSSLAGRPLRLAGAYARLREVCPSEWVAWMADFAPRAIVAGEPVTPPW